MCRINIHIAKAKKIYNNKYDYSKVKYIKSKEDIIIICPIHGEFKKRIFNHLNGQGCQKCAILKRSKTRIKKQSDFILDCIVLHGNRYDYSKVNYLNAKDKITIICSEHGEFQQTPYNHLQGKGCQKCGLRKRTISKTKTKEEFILDSIEMHGNKYDYSKVEYKQTNKKVIIICPKHGEFEQLPKNHIQGYGCLKCHRNTNYQYKRGWESFFKEYQEIYNQIK
jgi:hypothetical protein